MIVRNLFGVFAALVIAGLLSASTVQAKACPALCKLQIKACRQTNCTVKPKGPCKRECRKHFIDGCQATSTVPKERTCPASPSGAFLD